MILAHICIELIASPIEAQNKDTPGVGRRSPALSADARAREMGCRATVRSYPSEAMGRRDSERESERFPNGSEHVNPHSGGQPGQQRAIR